MPERIRFFCDEHIPVAVSTGLKQRGMDILTMHDAGRSGIADVAQLQFASEHQLVLVTFDADFLNIAQSGTEHAGIVWCPATKYSIGQLIRCLLLVGTVLSPDEMRNHIEYL